MLAKWSIVCRSKDQEGLGILDLEFHNKCHFSKWIFSLINEDGVWQQLIRNKYLGDKSITHVNKKPGDSQFWTVLTNGKDQFLNFVNFRLQNGKQIIFWEDIWLGADVLKSQYPN
jgi:hypothetical protein